MKAKNTRRIVRLGDVSQRTTSQTYRAVTPKYKRLAKFLDQLNAV